MAARFDARHLMVTGAAVSVVEGVLASPFNGVFVSQFSFSSTGTLVYVPGSAQTQQLQMVWVNRKGVEQPIDAPPHNYVMPRISPDGGRLAVGVEEAGDDQIWIYGLERHTLTRLTLQWEANVDPAWTPDGKRIVFKGSQNRLFWEPAGGSGSAEELTSSKLSLNNIPGSWSRTGRGWSFRRLRSPSPGAHGSCRSRIGYRAPLTRVGYMRPRRGFRRTAIGSPMPRTNPADPRFTWSPIRGRVGSIRSRPMAVPNQSGTPEWGTVLPQREQDDGRQRYNERSIFR